MNEQLT